MLLIDALRVLAALVHLREPDEAKKVAERVIAMADLPELWTIARAAAILDTHGPNVARLKLEAFAESLTDEHRSELVTFVAEHTGHRPRRVTPPPMPEPRFVLSVQYDTRPGFDEHDAQPGGLVVYPDGYEERRQHHKANTMTRLTHSLRDSMWQLPPHVRTALREEPTRTTDPERRRPRRTARQAAAAYTVAEYVKARLNVEDHTAEGMRTIFDIDDDKPGRLVAPRVMAARIAQIRDEIQARTTAADALAEATAYNDTTDQEPPTSQTTNEATQTTPDPDDETTPQPHNTEIQDPLDIPNVFVPGYEVDYAKAAQHPIRTTPCVWCFCERTNYDTRHMPHVNGYDDGLCVECREKGRRGLPKPPAVTVPKVAHLDREARREAARTAAVVAPCAHVARHLPYGAALVWMRAYYAQMIDGDDAWNVMVAVKRWQRAQHEHQPQPPTPPAAPALPAAPVPALAAA